MDFSSEIMEARKQGNIISKAAKGKKKKTHQPRKINSQMKGNSKNVSPLDLL